ncbi:MAG: nucleotidyltransferase family protein [Streptococcaceae bacterium]|jgi:predicted nucleotidyltransferase|nr:nucleotidyltransferase family protein [Streptococcaceae bacterium]
MAILTINEIKEKVAPIAEKYSIREVVLFGSYARGEQDEASDVDLMVDLEGTPIQSLMDLVGLQYELEDALGLPVDLLTKEQVYSQQYLSSRFNKRFEKEKKELYA